jgi:hypothetical protein
MEDWHEVVIWKSRMQGSAKRQETFIEVDDRQALTQDKI